MAMAAGPMTPIKESGEQGEGGSGNEQQDKEQLWEGMEPLGGAAAGAPLFYQTLQHGRSTEQIKLRSDAVTQDVCIIINNMHSWPFVQACSCDTDMQRQHPQVVTKSRLDSEACFVICRQLWQAVAEHQGAHSMA